MALLILALKAFMFGVATAAPLGPMCTLCMRRTMDRGWKYGLVTALGVSASDAVYAAIASFGLDGISDWIHTYAHAFHVFAGLVFICFGLKIGFSRHNPTADKNEDSQITLPYAFGSAVLMTLITNPLTLLFFVTGFNAFTPASGFDYISSLITVAAVFVGSFSWLLGMVVTVSLLRHTISDKRRILIDRAIGVFLILFGCSELWQFWHS